MDTKMYYQSTKMYTERKQPTLRKVGPSRKGVRE